MFVLKNTLSISLTNTFSDEKRELLYSEGCVDITENTTLEKIEFFCEISTMCHFWQAVIYFIVATSFYWYHDPYYRMDPFKQHTAHPFDPKLSVLLSFHVHNPPFPCGSPHHQNYYQYPHFSEYFLFYWIAVLFLITSLCTITYSTCSNQTTLIKPILQLLILHNKRYTIMNRNKHNHC